MTFDLELGKTVVGILSIALGTASGIAALVVEFKNKNTGTITKWGRYALGGLAVSFFIGIANLWIDYTQKSNEAVESRKKSQEASEKTLQIVTDLGRTLNPIKDVHASFWLDIPFDGPEISDYRKRLDTGIKALLPQLLEHKYVNGIVAEADPEVTVVTIGSGSPLFPDFKGESFAYNLFSGVRMTLNFYKIPVDFLSPAQLPLPDIFMTFLASTSESNLYIRYELKTKRLGVWVNNALSDPQFWNSSGKIISVLDLAGGQFGIDIGNRLLSIEDIKRAWQPQLLMLRLNIAERRPWFFRGDRLERIKLDRDKWFWVSQYSYRFPASYSEMILNMDTTPPLYLHP